MKRPSLKWVVLAITCFLLSLDRLLKMYSANFLVDDTVVITDFFQIHYSLNPYLAFSIPLGGILAYFLIGFSLLAISIIIFHLHQTKKNWPALLLTLVSVSAVTNLYDRIFYGGVIDYLEIINLSSFNLADLIISSAIILFIIDLQFKKSDNA